MFGPTQVTRSFAEKSAGALGSRLRADNGPGPEHGIIGASVTPTYDECGVGIGRDTERGCK
jgi:hypothetical protein